MENDLENDGVLRTSFDCTRWNAIGSLARQIDFDANKELVNQLAWKNRELDDWWLRRSKLGQRIYPFKTVKIPVMRPPKEARAIVRLHESVRANMTPRNLKLNVEYNIILARLLDRLRRMVQDDGGEHG